MRLIDADKLNFHYLPISALGDVYITKAEIDAMPAIVSQEDIEILKIIRGHFQVCFDEDSDNGLDTVVFNGFSLDGLWEDGYDDEFEKVKNWLWKG